jgi:hypothetical protein
MNIPDVMSRLQRIRCWLSGHNPRRGTIYDRYSRATVVFACTRCDHVEGAV